MRRQLQGLPEVNLEQKFKAVPPYRVWVCRVRIGQCFEFHWTPNGTYRSAAGHEECGWVEVEE